VTKPATHHTHIVTGGSLAGVMTLKAACRTGLGAHWPDRAGYALASGGPLDAPEQMPAGSMRSPVSESEPVPACFTRAWRDR
jgi:hypothetical protein